MRLITRLMEALAREIPHGADARPCAVLAPHPDDEVLGCGGTIIRKVQNGTPVAVIFLTDGRHGLPGSMEEVRELREREARRAAQALGLAPDRLAFLRFEDGQLNRYVEEAIALVREHVAGLEAEDLFVPCRRDLHPDHVAASQIGRACLPPGGRLFEYPVWYGPWLWSRLGWRARAAALAQLVDARTAVKVRIAEVTHIKRQAMAAYSSQVASFEARGRWGTEFLANFTRDYELFFARR